LYVGQSLGLNVRAELPLGWRPLTSHYDLGTILSL
jgi:hypothetical protein